MNKRILGFPVCVKIFSTNLASYFCSHLQMREVMKILQCQCVDIIPNKQMSETCRGWGVGDMPMRLPYVARR